MFEPISINKFLNREHVGEYADVEFDTYIDDHGKEEVEDIRLPLHYFEGGEGEPLILVHGIGQSLYAWRNNFEELAKSFHVYAIDLPGHGFSGKPRAAHLCALGDGGAFVLDFVLHIVNRAGRLVFISPMLTSNGGGVAKTKGLPSILGLTAGKMMLSENGVRGVLEDCYFDRTLVTDEVAKEYAMGLLDRDYKVIAKMCVGNFFDDDIKPNILSVQNPLLVILGAEDKITGGQKSEFLQFPLAAASSLTVRNCGFFVNEEKPDKVNEAIVEFCKPKKQGKEA